MYVKFREVDLDELRRLLSYDPDTGVITWKVKRRSVPAGRAAGCIDKSTGYMRVCLFGSSIYAHRVAWALFYGEWPDTILDHRDHCKTNNRIKNLRKTDDSKNQTNARRARNASGHRGVFWHPVGKKWFAAIVANGKRVHLGMFANPDEAASAYRAAAREMHGEFAYEDRP